MTTYYEKEEDKLDAALADGEITQEEFSLEMKLLRREEQAQREERAQAAYDAELYR